MKREEAIKMLKQLVNMLSDDFGDSELCEEALQMAITALQNQPVWIPVSERLPEESLNSVIGWDTYRNRCCFVQYLGGRFVLGDDIDSVNVTAWMPLPEPYRESEPHKQTNADRIRSMTDEELAEFIARNNYDCANYCEDAKCGCSWSCGNKDKTIALQWLQKESEE